jgi:GH15 family glucan-1,4-alpha-glucosidase
MRIEDFALIGDLQTSALVGGNGSVDWLCLPRFDSASCFTALLGEEKHGRWLISPAGEVRSVSRRYREGTLVLETDFETADGSARVIDFMPPRDGAAATSTSPSSRTGCSASIWTISWPATVLASPGGTVSQPSVSARSPTRS